MKSTIVIAALVVSALGVSSVVPTLAQDASSQPAPQSPPLLHLLFIFIRMPRHIPRRRSCHDSALSEFVILSGVLCREGFLSS